MTLYDIFVKPFVRRMDLDKASRVVLRYYQITGRFIPFGRFLRRLIYNNRPVGLQREFSCMEFYNPIGLSAGLDIHGFLYNDLNNLGFSFVQVGPMDVDGIRTAVAHIQEDHPDDILAVCINGDYQPAFTLGYDFFDFFVFDCKDSEPSQILDQILDTRRTEPKYKPVVLKISNDLNGDRLREIVAYCRMNGVDGIEAQTIEQVREIAELTQRRLPVIADAPIDTAEQAFEMLEAGADLLEVRNGLVREGPQFVQRILKYLLNRYKKLENERAGSK